MKTRFHLCRGLTLLEMVMVMALVSIIMVPMSLCLNVGIKNWNEDATDGELLQHARIAMQRMTSELYFAAGLVSLQPDVLEFYSRYKDESDHWHVEKVRFRKYNAGTGSLYALFRGEDTGTGYTEYEMAGSTSTDTTGTNISVSDFQIMYGGAMQSFEWGSSPLKLEEGDPPYLVEFVTISLKVSKGTKSVSLNTEVKLRNK